MPKELIAVAPRTPVLREYKEPSLKPGEVRLRSIFSAPKHGSELRGYRAETKDHTSPFEVGTTDARWRRGSPEIPDAIG